jgi:maltokinase
VPSALARNGSKLVAAPLGWIELTGCGQSMPVQTSTVQANTVQANTVQANTVQANTVQANTVQATESASSVLAILSVFFANSADGWSLATSSLHEPDQDFSREARLLGETTAQMHAELAEAFGSSVLSSDTLRGQVDNLLTELSQATRVVPELREHAPAVRDCYNSLTESGSQVTVQRIHGDYHLAQVLSTEGGWVVLDFEGEPSVPLARRRAFQPPLRDVAGMLRSFDYAARHEALQDRRIADAASAWARECRDAFCAGYADIAGGDPRANSPLLQALILQKAVYEAVYEARHRPDWLPIPLAAIAEAIQ